MVCLLMLTCISATEASATEVTRGRKEQTVTADVDREYVHSIYTGSTYCCVTVPPPFSKIRKRILKEEVIMMMHIDENTYNMLHIKEYTYG